MSSNIIKIILVLIALNAISLSSQEKPFTSERLITDFRGVVTNGKRIICYGDYGIITFSSNGGKSWEQQSFGDKYKVMKIETDGNEFYGVSDHFLFRGYNNDSYWVKQNIFDKPQIKDMAMNENSIYILTTNGILHSDPEMNYSQMLKLDSNSIYSELKTDGNNLFFISDSKMLLRHNILSEVQDTIDLIDDFDCYQCTTVSGLSISDSSIYVGISYKGADENIYYSLLKSSDSGDSWIRLIENVVNGNCYKSVDGEIYFLKAKSKSDSLSSFFTTQFSKLDSAQYQLDSTFIKVINDNEGIDRYIRWRKSISFTDFTIINEDTIIAVGKDKLISLSYDKGKTFEVKSFFEATNIGYYDPVSYIRDSIIIVENGYEFFKSTDKGITWLPQKYNSYNNNTYSSPDIYYFDQKGSGFAKYKHINTEDDSSALVTNDYGENLTKTDREDLNILTHGIIVSQKGIDLGNVILFTLNPETEGEYGKSYLILRYDKNFKLLDTTRYSGDLKNIIKVNSNRIIALYLISSGENKADSNGHTENYIYNYFLRESIDQGKTWDSVTVEVPIRQKLSGAGDNFYYSDISHRQSHTIGDNIYYPTTDKIIYRYDYVNREFDSLYYPATLRNYYSYAIFNSGAKLFSSSNYDNKIYYAELNGDNSILWDTISPEVVLNGWNNFLSSEKSENKDAILSAYMFSDSTGLALLGKSQKDYMGLIEYKLNFAKIRFYNVVKVNEPEIESGSGYIWHSNPYPIPGRDIIKTNLHWTRNTIMNEAIIEVYDIQGLKLDNDQIRFDKTGAYSGILKWECSNTESGIYIIQISTLRKSISFPVIISR